MGEKGGRPQNLKPFTGVNDPRRCKKSTGRPKGSRKLMNIIRELLQTDPDDLIDANNPKTLALIKNFKRKKLIRDTKDLLAIRIVTRALQGDFKAIDLVISQIGEDKPIKIDVNARLTKLDDLTNEQLEAIAIGDATFSDFIDNDGETKSLCNVGIEGKEKSKL